MAPELAPRRAGLRGWLLAATLCGTVLLALGAGTSSGIPTATRLAPVLSVGPSPVEDRLAAYGRPHATAQPPTPAPAATAAPAPLNVAPAANRAPAPAPRPVASHTVTSPPAPVAYHNRLVSSDGTLNTGVGYYGDCSGRTPLTHAEAAIDTCVGGRTYFVGHNPGVFTPLFHMGVGSIITWYDGAGNAHRLRIIGVRTWYSSSGVPNLLGGATAEFQTCITPDGSVDRIMDAAPA